VGAASRQEKIDKERRRREGKGKTGERRKEWGGR